MLMCDALCSASDAAPDARSAGLQTAVAAGAQGARVCDRGEEEERSPSPGVVLVRCPGSVPVARPWHRRHYTNILDQAVAIVSRVCPYPPPGRGLLYAVHYADPGIKSPPGSANSSEDGGRCPNLLRKLGIRVTAADSCLITSGG